MEGRFLFQLAAVLPTGSEKSDRPRTLEATLTFCGLYRQSTVHGTSHGPRQTTYGFFSYSFSFGSTDETRLERPPRSQRDADKTRSRHARVRWLHGSCRHDNLVQTLYSVLYFAFCSADTVCHALCPSQFRNETTAQRNGLTSGSSSPACSAAFAAACAAEDAPPPLPDAPPPLPLLGAVDIC